MFADFVVKYTQRSSIKIKKQKEAVSKAKHPITRICNPYPAKYILTDLIKSSF